MRYSWWLPLLSRRSGTSRPGRARSGDRKPWRPRLEALETRLAPACTTGIGSRVLTVNCDSAVNTVTVDHAGATTTVNAAPFADASFDSLRINLGTGGATVNLDATPPRPTSVLGVNGSDVKVRVSRNAQDLDTIQGAVAVSGGGLLGSILEIHDQAHAAGAVYTVTTTTVGRPGHTIDYFAMGVLLLNGSHGVSGYNITSSNSDIVLNTGNGSDSVNVGSLSPPNGGLRIVGGTGGVAVHLNDLTPIRGVVQFEGHNGSANTLFVSDQANTANADFRFTSSSITRQGFGVEFDTVDAISFIGGRGTNTYTVAGTGATSRTTLSTGSGSAVVNVEATTPGLPLTIDGSTGGMTVNLRAGAGI